MCDRAYKLVRTMGTTLQIGNTTCMAISGLGGGIK